MINERNITEKLMERLRADLRGAVVIKHADSFTAGVPDVSVSIVGSTNWIEVKYLRAGDSLRKVIGWKQLIFCHELSTTTNGRCWVVVYEDLPRAVPRSPQRRQMTIWTPRALAAHLHPKVVGGEVQGCAPIEQNGFDWKVSDLHSALVKRGAVRCTDGWFHELVSQLIREAA